VCETGTTAGNAAERSHEQTARHHRQRHGGRGLRNERAERALEFLRERHRFAEAA
jgi:hypothetical protein